MKKIFSMILVLIICFINVLIISGCSRVTKALYPDPKWDDLYASYPKYRIDDKIKKICIIGSGIGSSEITSYLTNLIMKKSDIKVVEPGNLQAILGGKFIEYGTGLSTAESQALAQMFQVDHIMLFEEKISPYTDYQYGGRIYNQINLKIINTVNGEIIFQASNNEGVTHKDPRPYGYGFVSEISTSNMNKLRTANLRVIEFQLRYALGNVMLGTIFADPNQPLITYVLLNSPAYNTGLQKGDKILEVNEKGINTELDIYNYLNEVKPKQGDHIKVKIERKGKMIDLEVELPIIPFSPDEPKKEKIDKKELPI